MANVNAVFLMGNLTRDIELRYTASGSPVGNMGLAVNRKYKSGDEWKEEVIFVEVTVWGSQAENCAKYLAKGSPCFIEGRLAFSEWTTDDGQKRNKLTVTANSVQFVGSKGEGQEKASPPKTDEVPF